MASGRWKLPLSALRSFPRVNLTNLQPFPGTRRNVSDQQASWEMLDSSESVFEWTARVSVTKEFSTLSRRVNIPQLSYNTPGLPLLKSPNSSQEGVA